MAFRISPSFSARLHNRPTAFPGVVFPAIGELRFSPPGKDFFLDESRWSGPSASGGAKSRDIAWSRAPYEVKGGGLITPQPHSPFHSSVPRTLEPCRNGQECPRPFGILEPLCRFLTRPLPRHTVPRISFPFENLRTLAHVITHHYFGRGFRTHSTMGFASLRCSSNPFSDHPV